MSESSIQAYLNSNSEEVFRAYHGTTIDRAESIQVEGFRVGTWFAFEYEVSKKYGDCIFTVELPKHKLNFSTFGPEDWWQFHTLEQIPVDVIVGLDKLEGYELSRGKKF